MTDAQRENRRRSGRLGGQATVAKYGPGYMAEIGRRGAAELYRRYHLVPYQVSGWMLVDRTSGEIKAAWR